MHVRPLRRLLLASPVCSLVLVLAACSSSSTPSTTTTSPQKPETAATTEFLSPSQNISCEIDNHFGASALTQTLCLSVVPPLSVVLKTDGSLTECAGQQCLSNAGTNTPTLAYGHSTTFGPFHCASLTSGVRCTLASGDGFSISTSGVTPLGGASVTQG